VRNRDSWINATQIFRASNLQRPPFSWQRQNFTVELLLERHVQPDSKDTDSRTPLSYVAEDGHEAMMKLLLEKGPDLESKDHDGRTPLFYAVWNGHEAVVKLLLEKGAKKP
jgi:ankyrin repeat protein